MMEKRMHSNNNNEIVDVSHIFGDAKPPKPNFDRGTKYIMNERSFIVTKAWTDSGTEWRHCVGNDGKEEVMELKTLHRDMDSPTFALSKLTANEELMMKARKN